MAAVQASDEIVQLAAQGNLQALSVYLNRHVIPSGAHVKVKAKADALHILVVLMREMDDQKLLASLKQLLLHLQPKQIDQVKLYSQVLGKNQPTLRDDFWVSVPPKELRHDIAENTLIRAAEPQKQAPAIQHTPLPSGAKIKESRYSIAEYLSQITNLDELQVLQRHPFFTGVCPHCQYSFQDLSTPPLFWDCPQCSWQDDLSTMVPQHQLQEKRHYTSLHESKRLGDYLMEAGLLTQTQIEVALEDQLNTGLRLGEVLARRGWVKEETIEYLMQKIILPERSGIFQNASSYLESSRNLLKNLLNQKSPAKDSSPSRPMTSSPQQVARATNRPAQHTGKLAHERETLILPDLDIDDLG